MTEQIEFSPDEMVTIPLISEPKGDDDHIEIALLELEGRRTIPIYTKGADTNGFIMNGEVPLYWYKFNFGMLISMLDENDLVLVNMGTPDEYAFAVNELLPPE